VSGRKRRPKTGGRGIVVILALLAVAIVAGYALLRPAKRPPRGPVAVATHAPAIVATHAPALPTPEATSTPEASPTPSTQRTGPKLALIVDDCGQWLATERAFITLPIPLTLSVLPDVRYNATIADEASAAGKGVMLHLPMETVSGVDPGPGEVTTEMTDAQIDAQVEHDLAQVPLAQGVNNHEGSKGSADRRVMDDVIATIAKHDARLFFIDSRTAPDSVAQEAARAGGLPNAARDVFLDNSNEIAYVEKQLRAAAAIAARTGSAIAIGHPRSATLAAVRALYPELQREGITFVLAADLTKR